MNDGKLNSIAVVGNDLAAWMTAALLAKEGLNSHFNVRICIGAGPQANNGIQAPLPDFAVFLDTLGISVQELVNECSALPTMGNCYHFSQEKFYHIWGEYGAARGAIEFHQLYIRAVHEGDIPLLNELSIAAAAAAQGRFAMPEASKLSIRSTYETSCAFSTRAFIALLQQRCSNWGVEVDERMVDEIDLSGLSPNIVLRDGASYSADYVFNSCPEFRSNNFEFEAWQTQLPFSCIKESIAPTNMPRLVGDIMFGEGFWEHVRYTRKHTEILRYNFSSNAHAGFSGNVSGSAGCLLASRAQQVIHIGEAAVKIPSPLFSEADLIWVALRALLKFFPSINESQSIAAEYNNLVLDSYRNLRDITQISLMLAERRYKGYFPHAEQGAQSEQLKHKLALFSHRGKIPAYENDVYKIQWQVWLLLGLGLIPDNLEPISLHMDSAEMMGVISKVKQAVSREVILFPLFS